MARRRTTGTRRSKKDPGITVVMEDGPCRCLVPIPRSDLYQGCPFFVLPFHLGFVRYRLDRITDHVHYYRWENPNES